jgi:hypothetical protein
MQLCNQLPLALCCVGIFASPQGECYGLVDSEAHEWALLVCLYLHLWLVC